jgi:hypothetical protein
MHGTSLLVLMVDVVRGGVYPSGEARHDNVEQFAHQDTGNGACMFEEAS